MEAVESILLLSAMRLRNAPKTPIERTLYSKCERVKYWYGGYGTVTSLYMDEQCTELVCKLHGYCPRIMKSGYYKLFDTFKRFQQYVYIVCVDNAVRREATSKVKYKYTYPKNK
jgi:hypothetical protein